MGVRGEFNFNMVGVCILDTFFMSIDCCISGQKLSFAMRWYEILPCLKVKILEYTNRDTTIDYMDSFVFATLPSNNPTDK